MEDTKNKINAEISYPYVYAVEQDLSTTFRQKANAKFKHRSTEWIVEYNILHLEYIVAHGLPSCYAGFYSFLFDFYLDFSWYDNSILEMEMVLADVRFPAIVDAIKRLFDFDLHAQLTQTVQSRRKGS